MKKNVMVIGIGKRKTGVSQKGNAFDFVPMAFTYEDKKSMEGSRCFEASVDTPDFESVPGIMVGDTLTVFMHEQNFRMKIDGIIERAY